jgi:hypothetical protein
MALADTLNLDKFQRQQQQHEQQQFVAGLGEGWQKDGEAVTAGAPSSSSGSSSGAPHERDAAAHGEIPIIGFFQ